MHERNDSDIVVSQRQMQYTCTSHSLLWVPYELSSRQANFRRTAMLPTCRAFSTLSVNACHQQFGGFPHSSVAVIFGRNTTAPIILFVTRLLAKYSSVWLQAAKYYNSLENFVRIRNFVSWKKVLTFEYNYVEWHIFTFSQLRGTF